MTIVGGPPCAGKSTWIRERAQAGDIVVDFDLLTNALTFGGVAGQEYSEDVGWVAVGARRGAVRAALSVPRSVDVWIIDTDADQKEYPGAEVVILDPGMDVCLDRAQTQRPERIGGVIREWYAARVERGFEEW